MGLYEDGISLVHRQLKSTWLCKMLLDDPKAEEVVVGEIHNKIPHNPSIMLKWSSHARKIAQSQGAFLINCLINF